MRPRHGTAAQERERVGLGRDDVGGLVHSGRQIELRVAAIDPAREDGGALLVGGVAAGGIRPQVREGGSSAIGGRGGEARGEQEAQRETGRP